MITVDERAEMQADIEAYHRLRVYVRTITQKINQDLQAGTISPHIAETMENGLANLKEQSPEGQRCLGWQKKGETDASFREAFGTISNAQV